MTGKSKKMEENNCRAGHVTERSLGAPVHRAMDKAVLPGWQRTTAGGQQGLCPSVRLINVLTPHTTTVMMYNVSVAINSTSI